MNAQAELNKIIGSVTSGVGTAIKVGQSISGLDQKTADKLSSSSKQPTEPKAGKEPGVDAKMAAKARRIAQQKINAIYANKELSNKARTRRIGKAIDEYNKTIGGGK
jgi:hypothetical protein